MHCSCVSLFYTQLFAINIILIIVAAKALAKVTAAFPAGYSLLPTALLLLLTTVGSECDGDGDLGSVWRVTMVALINALSCL